MFQGTINTETRAVLREIVLGWGRIPVGVGCSGAFTVERTLYDSVLDLHSCDVSLFSYALGQLFSGGTPSVRLSERGREVVPFLEDGLGTALDVAATILILSDYPYVFAKLERPYAVSLLSEIRRQWPRLLARTRERLSQNPLRVSQYYNGDVLEFEAALDADYAFVSYPPFYSGGYERLFKALDELFDWPRPEYKVLDDHDVHEFALRVAAGRSKWCIVLKDPLRELEPYLRGVVQHRGQVPCYVFASDGPRRFIGYSSPPARPVGMPRLMDLSQLTPDTRLELRRLTADQFEFLRAEYLGKAVTRTGTPTLALAVVADGYLCGAFAVRDGQGKGPVAYMLTDFSVLPRSRLSKLVLHAAMSREARVLIQTALNRRVTHLLTTAFTDRPVSMKYRGLFRLTKRMTAEDGGYALNYEAPIGHWTLQEGYAKWWTSSPSKPKS